eukprot:gene2945-5746_t
MERALRTTLHRIPSCLFPVPNCFVVIRLLLLRPNILTRLSPLHYRPATNQGFLTLISRHYSKRKDNHSSYTIMSSGSNTFQVEAAKTGRSGCKECKEKIDKGVLRIGKVTPSPFSDEGSMTSWFHIPCFFKQQMRARSTTQKVQDASDLEGFFQIEEDDRRTVKKAIDDFNETYSEKLSSKTAKSTAKSTEAPSKKAVPKHEAPKRHLHIAKDQTKLSLKHGMMGIKSGGENLQSKDKVLSTSTASIHTATLTMAAMVTGKSDTDNNMNGVSIEDKASYVSDGDGGPDDSFANFCTLCKRIADLPSYNDKTEAIRNYITEGEKGKGFGGDLYLVIRLLLPRSPKRVYNMKDKAFVRVFSQLLGCDPAAMTSDLEKGDCAETCAEFFAKNKRIPPRNESTLTLADVENFLRRMEGLTTIDAQTAEFRKLLSKCTVNDVRYIVRSMKHDLRTFAGPKHVLTALHPRAYDAWQASHSLKSLIDRIRDGKGLITRDLSVRASLMTAIKPMLAEACRSYERAFEKCPNGIYAEIKYDGERVQVHKRGSHFEFFSRSLKPVSEHKITFFRDAVHHACPHGDSLIIDAEVLMVDTKTNKPLPFGSLAFSSARPCLFVFDILHFNGTSLMSKTLEERREFLETNVVEVEHQVMYSEKYAIKDKEQLVGLMKKVMNEGLEGLVLKDLGGYYEPGKRRWLKLKKDYLDAGSLADTADLVVLGAYYGTGSKGGIMSVFLMGCRDSAGRWRTVGNGHTDAALEQINKDLDVVKISKDTRKVPSWLDIRKPDLVPDFIVRNPKEAPVWEVTGAEFSESTSHSADGISIRFPRVTKVRDDKDWESATTLAELKSLYETSKIISDIAPAPSFTASKDKLKEEEEEDESDEENIKDEGEVHAVSTHTVLTPAEKKDEHIDVVNRNEYLKEETYAPRTMSCLKTEGKRRSPGREEQKRSKLPKLDSEKKSSRPRKQASGYDLDGFVVQDGDDTDDDEDDDGGHLLKEDSDDANDSSSDRVSKGRGSPSCTASRKKCRYGGACYQKNPSHKRRFAHPGDDDWEDEPALKCAAMLTEAAKSTAKPRRKTSKPDTSDFSVSSKELHTVAGAANREKPLPLVDVFVDVTCFTSDLVDDFDQLYRYGIAYGADFVTSMTEDVTHVLVPGLHVEKWDSLTRHAVSVASTTGAYVVTYLRRHCLFQNATDMESISGQTEEKTEVRSLVECEFCIPTAAQDFFSRKELTILKDSGR